MWLAIFVNTHGHAHLVRTPCTGWKWDSHLSKNGRTCSAEQGPFCTTHIYTWPGLELGVHIWPGLELGVHNWPRPINRRSYLTRLGVHDWGVTSYFSDLAWNRVFTPEPEFLNFLRSQEIDSKESIPPAYVAWRAGTITLFLFDS